MVEMWRRGLVFLLLLLLVGGAQSRRGGGRGRGRGLVRGRGRAGAAKRSAADCKEYVEGGEKYLDCTERGLVAVPTGPTDVHHLILAQNKLQVLRDGAFAHLTQLRSLDLQQNRISTVEDGAFSGLDHLSTLLLQHNRLSALSDEALIAMPTLRYLRIYSNPWSCDCALDGLVRTLQVPSNRQLGNYAKCEEPQTLRGHKLKKLKAELLCEPPANERDPSSSAPEGGDVARPLAKPQDATSLCHTYMIPTPRLDCTSRDLKYVPADITADIVKMDLSWNSIRQLKARDFVAAKDLKMLNLSSNSLENIDTAAFAGLLYLRELDLSNNSLQFFAYGVLEDLYFLKRLALGGNPWRCDYSIHYLVYWLKHHPGVAVSGLVCSAPLEYAGWLVEDYVKTYNADCPKDRQLGGPITDYDLATGGANQDTAQELKAETEEEPVDGGLLPSPLRMRKTFEIIRLS